MNGRLYDPLTAQFLSPDNYVQDPTFTQNYNRYIYCLNNPLKYVDPSGYKQLKSWEEFWEVINNLMDYGGSWNSETGYSDGRQGGSIEGYGVLSGSGFHGPDQPYMLPGFEVTAKAPQKNTPTTPIIDNNNDPFRFDKNDAQGGGDKPDGMVYSVSFDFAFGGGAGVEIGLVTDKNGGKQWFVSCNANIGYGISAGPNVRTINSIPESTFKASDYLGYSAGFSAGLFELGGFYGGNKPQWNFTNFMDFGDTYIENGLGISKIKAPIFGAWWSNTSTKNLFGR